MAKLKKGRLKKSPVSKAKKKYKDIRSYGRDQEHTRKKLSPIRTHASGSPQENF